MPVRRRQNATYVNDSTDRRPGACLAPPAPYVLCMAPCERYGCAIRRVPLRWAALAASRFVLVPATVIVLLATGGCGDFEPMDPELVPVYRRIHEAQEDYEAGLELILSGDDLAGENQLAAATTRLVVATRECSRTPGCDVGLFLDSLGRLADERRRAIARQELDATARTPDAEARVGDGLSDDEPVIEADLPGEMHSLLTGADLAELIPLNSKVLAGLNDWLTWRRPELNETHRNYQFLRPLVAPVYEEAGLPEALLFAIMATESHGKIHAYSRAGAAGPLQFMPATALRYGLGSIDGFDTRLDPARSTRANARYVKDQLRRFRGNLELTLAAYNVGETRMRRIHRRHPGATFWDPDIYWAVPWETRNYVPQVLAAAWLFLHPEEYGLRFLEIEATSTTVVLEEAASLGELTICLGQQPGEEGWFRTLRNLNPRLSPSERAPAGTTLELPTALVGAYAERCVGEAPLIAEARRLHDADYPAEPELIRYTVRSGDTLAALAGRHRSSVRELAELNRIPSPQYVIRVGQHLQVPARQ